MTLLPACDSLLAGLHHTTSTHHLPFVFHRNGERIKYSRAACANACEAAGCSAALMHDMRRSAVRTFERAGVPRSVTMLIVGQQTESICPPLWQRGRSYATRGGGSPVCLRG
jgi:hypothetical protein